MKSYVMEDGRWRHKLRQSWMKTADTCAERARLEHEEGFVDVESDAACVGTAMHTAIELCLTDVHEGHGPLSLADTLEIFHMDFSRQIELPEFKWIKYTEKAARKFGVTCTTNWYEHVLPTLPRQAMLETKFVVPLFEDDHRVVKLSGTIDYIDDKPRDWKTSSRGEYPKWEYQRWGLQATIYTYAVNQLGLMDYRVDLTVEPNEVYWPFEYVVMHAKGVQRFEVRRTKADWEWLRMKAKSLCLLIEADLPEWPRSDNHALCSEKWCPAWSMCKGASGITF